MKISIKSMILVSLFAALTAVGAYISLPIGEVPITLQFLFTAFSAILLGARLGALSQLIYVLIGLAGLPVFAGGTGGMDTVISPSFGYLIGFILAAYIIGKIAEKSERPSVLKLFIAALTGIAVIYAIGIPYMYIIMNNVIGKSITLQRALKGGFLIFLPGDLLKCILTSIVGARLVPRIKQFMS